jgi:hypothetical protein
MDDDGDTLIDCADPDCVFSGCEAAREAWCQANACEHAHCANIPGCFESDCRDGADNDEDGLTDCYDRDDCGYQPECLGPK